MRLLIFLLPFFLSTCKPFEQPSNNQWQKYDQSGEINASAEHKNGRMQFKLIQSKYLDKGKLFDKINKQLVDFSQSDYNRLLPLILEKNILQLQESVKESKMTYKQLTQWYLFRILKFENTKDSALHAIIDINPKAVEQAQRLDMDKGNHPIYGMPIMLKDNINTLDMPTTAGAHVLKGNQTDDAFIVKQMKKRGAIIIGKLNLSEWAYFLCSGCPLGYSAIGGQTLNPYGRKVFETGGSSAGSGVATAANFAAATVGTETSGSILSPSSQNSIVGMKPTVGKLSRSGIVPISSTLDTPGPMSKNVIDNAILLSAMMGKDLSDSYSKAADQAQINLNSLKPGGLNSKRIGAFKYLMESDSIYNLTIQKLKEYGTVIVEIEQTKVELNGFLTLLNIDMKNDLPKYLAKYAGGNINERTIDDVISYNLQDTSGYIPYGQQLFDGISNDTTTTEELEKIKLDLMESGKKYFEDQMQEHNLEGVVSINNYHAGYAAVAHYPCITVPMGYKESGEPISLTFIARPFEEQQLLMWAYDFEQKSKIRKMPNGYGVD
jgi:amidase